MIVFTQGVLFFADGEEQKWESIYRSFDYLYNKSTLLRYNSNHAQQNFYIRLLPHNVCFQHNFRLRTHWSSGNICWTVLIFETVGTTFTLLAVFNKPNRKVRQDMVKTISTTTKWFSMVFIKSFLLERLDLPWFGMVSRSKINVRFTNV